MDIPDPVEFSSGERVTASKMNQLADLADWSHEAPTFQLGIGGDLDLMFGKSLTWSQIRYENVGIALPSTIPGIPFAGLWFVTAQVVLEPNTSEGEYIVQTILDRVTNGGGYQSIAGYSGKRIASGSYPHIMQVQTLVDLGAGDALRVRARSQVSGLTVSGSYLDTYLKAVMLQRPLPL